mmetsp:Transcript_10676/g.27802  ORF Transcript_10676/g.27802 Transcript_10676/m.27802 type:complete len:98 (-) Transcript_10676:1397-1690(-)|eukprot:1141518-Pelagomonas_calceolata.AAC.2
MLSWKTKTLNSIAQQPWECTDISTHFKALRSLQFGHSADGCGSCDLEAADSVTSPGSSRFVARSKWGQSFICTTQQTFKTCNLQGACLKKGKIMPSH